MLDFIGSVFKGIVSFLIVIALIAVLVGGFIVMQNSFLLALLVWVGGFISIVLAFGMISIFVEINENLKILISKTGNTSLSGKNNPTDKFLQGNIKNCPFCAEEIKLEAKICPLCGKNIKEYDAEKKLKEKEIEKMKIQENKRYSINFQNTFV